ncbi:MAG: hypothetical protein JSR55_07635 [Proteobacteria bacterium]|nr:hypothetical protein [Pseudomonadota bacterium]
MFAIVTLSLFVLSWVGAAGAWTVAAYSTLRVWTNGPLVLTGRYRARALTAGAVSATFVVTGILAGMASGLFDHLHV